MCVLFAQTHTATKNTPMVYVYVFTQRAVAKLVLECVCDDVQTHIVQAAARPHAQKSDRTKWFMRVVYADFWFYTTDQSTFSSI